MGAPSDERELFWQKFHGPNLGYMMEQYDDYLENPNLVDTEICQYFERYGPPKDTSAISKKKRDEPNVSQEKLITAIHLADRIRAYGHISADIYPFENQRIGKHVPLDDHNGLSQSDLEAIPAQLISPDLPAHIQNGYDAIQHLIRVYTGKIAFEIQQVHNLEEQLWLRRKIEAGQLLPVLSSDKKKQMLMRLIEVEEFEKFIHKTFVGQKRFSIEGLDMMVPLIDEIILEMVAKGVSTINIGMAHRGRLNVLAHNLGKPYEMIFAEFQHAPNKELVPSEGSIGINFGWTGDVKYHLGLNRQLTEDKQRRVKLTLANNPSHLEFVGPVVEGFTRSAQDATNKNGYPIEDLNAAMAILIHGDAAFPGQGIVAETLNLSQLNGYRTGGSIHIIANNLIGFTTERSDSRSTRYSSDLAKGFELPILHVNGDDPEAVLAAARLACEYRNTFNKDFIIDLVGYRRFGHNEMDEPMTTNPLLYKKIKNHPTVKELYTTQLMNEEVATTDEVQSYHEVVQKNLQNAFNKVPKVEDVITELNPPSIVEKGLSPIETAVTTEKLKSINEELVLWPKEFQVFHKLQKILQKRRDVFKNDHKVEWGLAETLAFATILIDGTPIRLSGQDSERGTFAHRNIVLYDQNTGEKFSPLHHLSEGKASFAVYNSPLSEGSVLGFEYGYNVFSPETLVLWEAQFGDFSNAAQVIFDQFISAGRAKWGEKSGLVILLPHGYEGQGPEHSSARLERFLSLAAENNWTVANVTSAAQYFHILRRQAAILLREEVRPLVIMTPKSLLRNSLVASDVKEFSDGGFRAIIEEPRIVKEPNKIERIVMGTGKIMVQLNEELKKLDNQEWLHVIRIEELYPFPKEQVIDRMKCYEDVKEVIWIQEEPKNMGAWSYVEPILRECSQEAIDITYIGRRRRSSPAEGDPTVHKKEQANIIQRAITR